MSLPSDFWGRIVFLFEQYGASYLKGAGTTLLIAVVSTFFGCVIGFIVGIIQTIPVGKHDKAAKRVFLGIVNAILKIYVELFRGTPMMVQAMFIYYGAAQILSLRMNMWVAALFIVSINTGAYMAETVRGGIVSIDIGQTEGASAIGMTHLQTMMYVVFPQALRNILPQIGNNLIINIKDTAVLNIITVPELFFAAKTLTGSYYQYFQTYFIDCVVYFVLTFTCSRLLRMYEKKLDGPDSYNLAGTGGKPAPGKRPTGVTMQLMSGKLREQRSAMR